MHIKVISNRNLWFKGIKSLTLDVSGLDVIIFHQQQKKAYVR